MEMSSQYKLGRAARNAAIHNFDASVYFALSATHDVGAISQLLHAAAADMQTSLRCFQVCRTSPACAEGGRGL